MSENPPDFKCPDILNVNQLATTRPVRLLGNKKMAKPTVHDRYAHHTGRLFEDFVVGDIYHHLPGRTISQHDNAWFTLLTMNTHPL